MEIERHQIRVLRERLTEVPRFMIVVAGPRQVGKTTLVKQALKAYPSAFVATDQPLAGQFDPLDADSSAFLSIPTLGSAPNTAWLVRQWTKARGHAKRMPEGSCYVLAIDEIQKIPRWSETVKGLWDADRAENLPLHIVLLGSSPWLMQKGLTESLAGRYEPIRLSHWSYDEMQAAFDFSLDEYIYFGGYPGSAGLIRDEQRWRQYVRSALIHPNIEKDILQMTRVDKPALLKTLFELGCGAYSGQIISYTKLQGDAGALPATAGASRTAHGFAQIRRAATPATRLQPQTQHQQQRPGIGHGQLQLSTGPRRPQLLGAFGRKRCRRAPDQHRVRHLPSAVLARRGGRS
jgi:uncharacterized protein